MSSKSAFDRITDNAPFEVLKKPDPAKRLPAPSRKGTAQPDNGPVDQPKLVEGE